jgi:hypothetical protein
MSKPASGRCSKCNAMVEWINGAWHGVFVRGGANCPRGGWHVVH